VRNKKNFIRTNKHELKKLFEHIIFTHTFFIKEKISLITLYTLYLTLLSLSHAIHSHKNNCRKSCGYKILLKKIITISFYERDVLWQSKTHYFYFKIFIILENEKKNVL